MVVVPTLLVHICKITWVYVALWLAIMCWMHQSSWVSLPKLLRTDGWFVASISAELMLLLQERHLTQRDLGHVLMPLPADVRRISFCFLTFWQSGLSLILKVDQNDHIPLLSTVAGVKVMIHSHNQTPFLEHEEFDIRPGIETTIGIKQVGLLAIKQALKEKVQGRGKGETSRTEISHFYSTPDSTAI